MPVGAGCRNWSREKLGADAARPQLTDVPYRPGARKTSNQMRRRQKTNGTSRTRAIERVGSLVGDPR